MDHSAGLARLLGADVIVIHPGFLLGRSQEQAIADVVEHLREVGERLAEKDRLVPFGVELMGRVRDLGSLDDIVAIARAVEWVRPVVDLAHFQATSDGGLRTAQDFAAVLERAGSALRPGERLHVHLSDIRYANRNEDRHVAYGEGALRLDPLAAVVRGFQRSLTLISESPDAASHLAIGRTLGIL
jgi:deoxyribonuclease-4